MDKESLIAQLNGDEISLNYMTRYFDDGEELNAREAKWEDALKHYQAVGWCRRRGQAEMIVKALLMDMPAVAMRGTMCY